MNPLVKQRRSQPRLQPITQYPGRVALFLLWNLIGGLAYARHYLQIRQLGISVSVFPDLLDWLSCFYPWIVLAPIGFKLEKRFPLNREQWRLHAIPLIIGGVLMSYVAAQATMWLGAGIDLTWHRQIEIPRTPFAVPLGDLCLQQFLY